MFFRNRLLLFSSASLAWPLNIRETSTTSTKITKSSALAKHIYLYKMLLCQSTAYKLEKNYGMLRVKGRSVVDLCS